MQQNLNSLLLQDFSTKDALRRPEYPSSDATLPELRHDLVSFNSQAADTPAPA